MNLSDFFPSVVFFNPDINSETSITTLNPVMNITFNTEIDYSQVSTNTALNQVIYLIEESSKRYIPLNFISYSSKLLVLSTSGSLSPGLFYQLTILNTLKSDQGRTANNNRTFSFQAEVSNVNTPQLVLPSNYTSVSSIPMFVWDTVTSPGTGTLSYTIQIDRHLEFNSLDWTTNTVLTSAYPGISFNIGETYYWRVLATYTSTSGSSISAYSDVFSFYYGSALVPSPDTQQIFSDALSFQQISQGFDNSLSNQSIFPSLTFRFNTQVASSSVSSSTLIFTRESVDGFPNTGKIPVNYSCSYSGNTITVTPLDNIVQNSRYTLMFTAGILNTDSSSLEPFITYFTSKYTPLYVGVNVIRANFGRYLISYSDDILNFYIYRESLAVNRDFIYYYSTWAGGPTEEQVRGFAFNLTWPMEKYVECKVSQKLLTNRYYELLENAGTSEKLADFSIEQRSDILREINAQIRMLDKEALKYSAEFSRHRAKPSGTRQSERWSPHNKYTDLSYIGQVRTGKF